MTDREGLGGGPARAQRLAVVLAAAATVIAFFGRAALASAAAGAHAAVAGATLTYQRTIGRRKQGALLFTLGAVVVAVSLQGVPGSAAAPPARAAAAATVTPIPKSMLPCAAPGTTCNFNSPQWYGGHAQMYGWGAATMADGSVIVGDIWNKQVVHFDTSGNPLPAGTSGVLFTEPPGQAPYGLAVDQRNGVIYVGRQTPGVEVWVPNPSTGVYALQTLLHCPPPAMTYPSRIAVDPGGNVYVADMLGTMKIYVFGPYVSGGTQGQCLWSFGGHGSLANNLIQPRAMAFDNSTPPKLYVVDAGHYRVSVFQPDPVAHTTGPMLNPLQNPGGGKARGFCLISGDNIRGFAIDNTRHLGYLVDMNANTIHKYDLTTGACVDDIGRGDTTSSPPPLGTFSDGGREDTVDGKGNLWVGDMPNFRVQVFDPTNNGGTPLFSYPGTFFAPPAGGFNSPRGVVVDPNGNVWVTDTYNFRLEQFNAGGNFVLAEGTRGRFTGEAFNYTRNIVVDPVDGSFFLADLYNNAIKKFDSQGVFLWQLVGKGSAAGQFARPSGVAVDSNRNLVVADSGNSRLQVFQPVSGAGSTTPYQFVKQISNSNTTGCSFTDPRGVAVDPATGDIYVADNNSNARLARLDTAMTCHTLATKDPATIGTGGLASAADVVIDSRYIYVSDGSSAVVDIYNLSDGSFNAYAGVLNGPGHKAGRFNSPAGLAIAPGTGYLYVAEESNDRVSIWCVTPPPGSPTC